MSRSHFSKTALPALCGALLALAFIPVAPRPALADPPHYTLLDLGALGVDSLGNSESLPLGINASGQVVGESSLFLTPEGVDLGVHAFLYSNGALTDLTALSSASGINCYSAATGINDKGVVVGFTQEYGGPYGAGSPTADYGFRFEKGKFEVLGNLGTSADGLSTSEAYAINSSGAIVGYSAAYDASGNELGKFATLFNNSGLQVLASLPAPDGSFPFTVGNAINASGQVAGTFTPIDTVGNLLASHAILISGGLTTDLGALGDPAQSQAYGINASGQIVGVSQVHGTDQAFLYSNGKMTGLGKFASSAYGSSRAWGINAAGTIVGDVDYTDSTGDGPSRHGFLYTAGTLIDLNALVDNSDGWTIEGAYAINDSGQIAVQGYRNGSEHALLLTPVVTSADLAITPGSVCGGLAAVGTVTLPRPVTSATTITLVSDSTLTQVPATVKIAAGKRSASFPVVTHAVRANTMTKLTAKMNKQSMYSAVNLHPVHVQSLTLATANVKAHKQITGSFTLEAPAGPGALTATFASSNPKVATLHASQTLPVGSTNGTFLIQAGSVAGRTSVTLTMTLNGVSRQVVLTIVP